MSMILINYDLINPGQDYETVITHIKSYEGWANVLASTWAVSTSQTTSEVRDGLTALTDKNDKFYVVDITGRSASWFGMSDQVSAWLK